MKSSKKRSSIFEGPKIQGFFDTNSQMLMKGKTPSTDEITPEAIERTEPAPTQVTEWKADEGKLSPVCLKEVTRDMATVQLMQQEIFELRVENHNLKTELKVVRERQTEQEQNFEARIARLEGLVKESTTAHFESYFKETVAEPVHKNFSTIHQTERGHNVSEVTSFEAAKVPLTVDSLIDSATHDDMAFAKLAEHDLQSLA